MDSFLLLSSIKETLSCGLSDWELRKSVFTNGRFTENTDVEQYSTPSVLIGQLPPKDSKSTETQSDLPFILIRPIDGSLDGEDKADYEINVAIICGIYSYESRKSYEAGVEDVMNLNDRLLQILSAQRFWADNRFKRTGAIKWNIGATRAHGPYEAGLQEQGPFFHMVIEIPFEREIPLIQNSFLETIG